MSGINHPTRIRKSLLAIQGTDQRKGFFYCLKLLGVLPPPVGSDFGSWLYKSRANFPNYKPKCLHDVLIGNHATSCEHSSIYFPFYHRHLMIIAEIFLNYIHQILRGGFPTLGESYPPSAKFANVEPFKSIVGFKFNPSTQFDFLYQGSNITLWTNAFSAYKTLKGIPDQIACHYWAPTNYLQDADLTVPAQLAANPDTNDPFDILFRGINHSYPWEINTQRRWFNTPADYKEITFTDTSTLQPYTDDQINFLNGQLDPRKNPKIFNNQTNFLGNYQGKNRLMVESRVESLYNNKLKNYRLNAIQSRQSIANYGGKSKNLQYLTKAEKAKLQSQGNGGAWMQSYNMGLPHYQYAKALFNSMKYFIEGGDGFKGLQRSHDYIHNNFRNILNNSSFSLTSFIFYPYHSWIDGMLQIRMRYGNKPNSQNSRPDYEYLQTLLRKISPRMGIKGKDGDQLPLINKVTNDMSKWYLSGDDVIPQSTAGRYPIFQWISQPKNSTQMSFAFCSRDVILTKTDIRDTFHLNELYHFPEYVKLFKNRYAFYKNLDKFNFNCNYQIGSSPNDRQVLLNNYGTNMPKYLLAMYKDVSENDLPKQESLSVATNVKKISSKAESSPEEQDQIKLQVRKLFEGNIALFASYSPAIKNGSNPVILKLKNVFKHFSKISKDYQLQQIEKYVSKGIPTEDIYIFGKEQGAKDCPRCLDLKGKFVNLDDDLRVRTPRIWKYLNIASLNQVFYDSSNPEKPINSIYDKLDLVPNPKFVDYRFVQGAQEIFIDVKSNIFTKEAKFIRIDTESYSVRTNTIKIVASKKHQTFNTNFDFYKLFDVDNENDRNYFDHYVYKELRGWVSVGSERVKFQFFIPSFQRALRLTLFINRQEGKLHIKIVDTDYQAKHAYYQSYRI